MTDVPEDAGKPPDGVVAGQVLSTLADKQSPEHDARLDTPPVSQMPRDPNYAEPYSLEAFQLMADSIIKGDDLSVTVAEQRALIKFLLARVKQLTDALMPFGMSALVMSNARMCLIADGRATEPAGGTWVSQVPGGIQLQPNEGYFFNACDAIGRERATEHLAAVLEKIKKANLLQSEKDAHVSDGGKMQ